MREVRQHVQVVQAARAVHVRQLVHQAAQAAHLRQGHGEIGRRDHRRHLDEELDHVDHQHAPQAGMRGEYHVEQAHRQQRLPAVEPEQHGGDLARRQVHRGHDDAVEEEAQVDRAEAAHRAGGLAGIAQLVEFQVGEHAGAAPQARVEEHRGHARQRERPPLPVAGHALGAHEVGHQVGRVARERGGHHGEAGQPPRHGAAGGEKLRRALSRALPEEQRRREADGHARQRNDPIERVKLHRGTIKSLRHLAGACGPHLPASACRLARYHMDDRSDGASDQPDIHRHRRHGAGS